MRADRGAVAVGGERRRFSHRGYTRTVRRTRWTVTCPWHIWTRCRRNVLHQVGHHKGQAIDRLQFRASILDLEAAGLDGLARKTAVLACHDPVSARKFVGVNPPIVRVCPGHQAWHCRPACARPKTSNSYSSAFIVYIFFFVGRGSNPWTRSPRPGRAPERSCTSNTATPPRVEPIQMPWTPRKLAFKVRNVLSPEQCKVH